MGIKVSDPLNRAVQQTINSSSSLPSSSIFAYPSKAKSQQEAKKLGCKGVNKIGDLWMPYAIHHFLNKSF